jgi:predicted ATPase/DNA-binding winged helix-turn-helix (wHTH) protein/class 3 adenylate cyclase
MIFAFDDYELDIARYELRRAGQSLQIEPKVLDLLAYLVQRHDQFVSKAELYEHLWPNQYVSESSLTYCIVGARKAVGDNGRAQRMIKTVYGRGYRFIAPTQERLHAATDTEIPTLADLPLDIQAPSPSLVEPEGSSAPTSGEVADKGLRGLEPDTFKAERRQLTVMWCRVVASPVLSAQLDPEDLREVLQGAYAGCVEVIGRFEGHVAQHLGDGFMVYFGFPQAHEDDAHRSIRTGLEIVRQIGRLNDSLEPKRGVKLTVRVGIQTGLVVIDEVQSGDKSEPLILGDAPRVAVQLAGLSEPNSVVISPNTMKLTEGYFVSQVLGQHVLEDLEQPLVVYRILRASNAKSRLAAAVTVGLTPFVGRRQEVGLLRERWELVKRGMGQVVLLSGEAGIGKSRLLQVLRERMAGETITQIDSRCSPYFQNSALYPVLEVVQGWLPWERDDSPQVKLGKLESMLASYSLTPEETVPLFAPLLALPLPTNYSAFTLTPQRQRGQTLETLLTMLLRQAEQQPVCLVMEDLQWVDASTLEWLGLLIDQTPKASMLILLTFRPDFHPPWAVRSHITHIALSRLTSRQIERMTKRITRGKSLPAEVLQQLVVKSDGVPLFVEEMTRMVLESGLVKELNGQYEIMGPLTASTIPSTLHDLLMARLDRLGTAKQVAQLGAILGREFSYEVIRAVALVDEPTLQHELTQLVEAELLQQRGRLPQAEYLFKHVLIQEAAYQSLLRRTRRQYHKRIAAVLETQFPDMRQSRPELLAHHYTEAGLHEKAIEFWQQAAQQALEHSAHLDAMAHVQKGLKALALLPESPERLQYELTLQTMLAAALTFTKGYSAPEVVRTFARARELSEQVGDMQQLFTVLRGLWWLYLVRSELPTAYELGDYLLRLAQHQNDSALLLEAHRALGTSQFFLGEQVAVEPHLACGLKLYNARQHRALTIQYGQDTDIMLLYYTALNLWLRGYPDQALYTIHQMLSQSQQRTHYSRSHALNAAAVLHQWLGETSVVYERVKASIALAEEHVFPYVLALGTILQGWVRTQQGDLDAGIEQIHRGLAAYRSMGVEIVITYILTLLAEAYQQAGNIAEGLRILAEALALVDKNGERFWEVELYRLQAELLLQQAAPDVEQAETILHHALAVSRTQQVKSLELRATISLCRLWQQKGKRRQARDTLKKIYFWFTEGHNTTDLKEAKALLDTI